MCEQCDRDLPTIEQLRETQTTVARRLTLEEARNMALVGGAIVFSTVDESGNIRVDIKKQGYDGTPEIIEV